MMLTALMAIQLICGSSDSNNWLENASKRVDQEAIVWVRQKLKDDPELEKLRASTKESLLPSTKKCQTTAAPVHSEDDIPLYVMMSFSISDETWINLSKEMEETKAVFVLRGLPNNSFKELSKKVQRLNSLGVKSQIQIDPKLFTTYQIDHVPSFLIVKEEKFDKISGNISLAYALEKMGEKKL